MPTCICKNGHVTHWEGFQGSRMPEICRVCNQPNMLARWVGHDETNAPHYAPVAAKRRQKREKITCPVCGKSRYVPSGSVKKWDHPVYVDGKWIQEDGKWVLSQHLIEPGQYVCWFHNLVTPEA